MRLLTRLQVWWRRRKLKAEARKQQAPPLREFVYLDEVSVYSLNASRLGSVAADFSETQSSSLQSEVSASLGAGAAGAAAAGLNSRLLAGQSRESQVNRTAIVQTAFKEFYELELELDSFAMRPVPEDRNLPEVRGAEALATETRKARPDGWIVDPKMLSRGRLVEAEVELEADAAFRMSAVIAAMLDIVEGEPEMFGDAVRTGLAQGKAIHGVLEKLLAGLVPVRSRIVDYEAVNIDGREWIVHRRLLSQLAGANGRVTRPLYVVGVAEQGLFWKDLRRVLFSGARFRVLVRMAQDGIRDTWTPVKLTHVLETVTPGLAKQLNGFGPEMIAAISDDGRADPEAELQQLLGQRALTAYAERLADHNGYELAAADLRELEPIAAENGASLDTAPGRQRAFGEISSFLHDRFYWPADPEVEAECRGAALQQSGLDPFGRPVLPAVPDDSPAASLALEHTPQSTVRPTANTNERYLDSEIVAIYW
ncbi:MAG: hypothetical protein M3R38_20320 [Actinomycetota bacterium]|nr:hypothetical protein [Actinomycetota bacterium]